MYIYNLLNDDAQLWLLMLDTFYLELLRCVHDLFSTSGFARFHFRAQKSRVSDPDPGSGLDPYSIGPVDPDPDPGGQKLPTKVEKNL